MKNINKCQFDLSWIGLCGKPTINNSNYCAEHSDKKCSVCGDQATHDCPTASSLMCGAPLCSKCRHGCMGNKEYNHKLIDI